MTAVYAGKGRAPGEAEACLFSRAAKSIGPTCNRKHVQPIDIVSRQGKVQKGKDFDLDDLLAQLRQLQNMGGMGALLAKLPAQLAARASQVPQGNEKEVRRQVAIICSMTPGERRYPKNIDGSRKRRIATGSGTQVSEVNRLLKNFLQMQKMMKGMAGKGGMGRMLRALGGRLPPGMH